MTLFYRFLLYGYVRGVLDRQLLGLSRTMGVAASLAAYLLILCVPPFLLARRNPYHPVWSGLECLLVYAVAAVVIGSLCALFAQDGWGALDAIVAGGEAWATAGYAILLVAMFLGAGKAGSVGASARARTSRKSRGGAGGAGG